MQKVKLYMRAGVAFLLLITMLLSGCSGSLTVLKRAVDEKEYAKEDVVFDADIKDADGLYNVATVGDLQLYIDGKTAAITVMNSKTGVSWSSNPQNDTGNEFIASQFSVNYVDDEEKEYERNSYADSVLLGQYSFYPLENGIRVNYTVNEKEKKYLVSPVIGADRFEKILSKLSEEDRMMLESFYTFKTLEGVSPEAEAWQKTVFPALRYGDIYVLSSGYSNTQGVTASDLMLQMIEPYFISAGYTEEDLKYDTAQNLLEPIDEEEYSIEISIEYTLDENGLTARIPQKSIIYDEKSMKLTNLTFLPFMGATDKTANGYMLIPDGSGAIIEFNNGKKTISAYEKRIYGDDRSLQKEFKDVTDGSQIYLPVFGVSHNNSAMLAVIENGDAVATIHSDVSGKLNDYNYVYSSYKLIENSIESNSILNQSGASLYQREPLKSDIQIKYIFTDNDNGSYIGMASAYRDYLISAEKLKAATARSSSISFAINTIGSVSYKTTRLGMPIEAQKALTTFEQAEEILKQLKKADIENITFSYSGWMNNGLYGKAPYKIDPVKALGGKRSFNNLTDYISENKIDFFPEVNFTYVTDMGNGYSKNGDTARDLSGNLAKNHTYNLAIGNWNEEDFQYIVSPSVFGKIAESFMKASDKYSIKGISTPHFSNELNGDYDKEACIDRQQALKKTTEALASISKAGKKIQVDGANAYTLANASFVTGVPLNSGNHYLFDRTVPFYQAVLHGAVPYSSTPLNLSGDFERSCLKCIEYGASPYFKWIYADNIELKETDYNIYNVNYALWFEDAIEAYKDINDALSDCQNEVIVSHNEISKNLYKTTYSNGNCIYVNYGDEVIEAEGQTIMACDYVVVKGAQ